jgi:peroxiredoxin
MNALQTDQPTGSSALIPREGWHVLHLFYQIDHAQWNYLSDEEKRQAKTDLTELVREIRTAPDTQLLTQAIVSPKADMGFVLLTPDLHTATAFEKQLTLSLGPDILNPVYSYFSLTERSEYTPTREQHAAEVLIGQRGLSEGTAEFDAALAEFDARMEHYTNFRLYPRLPDWPVICFYPMSKRRSGADNWYSLPFAQRRQLMEGHAKVGRTYAGRILQMITGSTGLDEWEWGVTLLAKDTSDVKAIVYEMRFDEVSGRFEYFGFFYF